MSFTIFNIFFLDINQESNFSTKMFILMFNL